MRDSSRTSKVLAAAWLFVASVAVASVSGHSGPANMASAAPQPMYAYTSANSGHWSYKISPAASHSIAASFGDFSTNTNWRCSWNTNMANRAGTKIYQGRSCDNVVTEIDVATDTYRTLAINARSNAMAVSPDGRYLYTAEAYYINKWDLSVSPPQRAYGGSRNDNNAGINLGILPDGSKLYSPAIQGGKNQVQVFSSSLALLATITNPLIVAPAWALPNPQGTEVWIGAGNSFIVVDPATDTVSRTYTFAHGTTSLPSFNSTGTRLYLSAGDLLEFDTSNGTVTRTITGLGAGSHASISPDDRYVYVAYGQTQKWVDLSSGSTGTITLPTQTPNNDTPRTIVWARPTEAPSIVLSAVSGSAVTGSPVGSLYSITNSGGDVSSYSVTPALPAGLVFSQAAGTISGTPTAVQAATTHTITATNLGGTSTATFTLTVTAPPPTTTTSTTTSSTTTLPNTPQTTTTVAAGTSPASTVDPVVAPAGTVASSAPAMSSPNRVAAGVSTGAGSVPQTTTTMAATITTTTTVPPPEVADAAPGSAVATLDGLPVETRIERRDNNLVVSAAGVSASVYGIGTDGKKIDLDGEGNLVVMPGARIVIDGSGYEPGSEVEIWLFSDPTLLGPVRASAGGDVSGSFVVPPAVETGDHRVVLSGLENGGSESIIGVGLRIGAYGKEDGLNRWLIILPLVLATMLALVIPTTARRRKRANG